MSTPVGTIKLFIGPMFASKTSSMCNEIEKYSIANKLCVIIKFLNDDRYQTDGVATHSGRNFCRVPILRACKIADIYEEAAEYEVIGIDEVQFFPDNVEHIQRMANSGKIVICSGLDGNFMAKSFGRMGELVAIAEDVIKLKAVCMRCCADASFTKKIAGGNEEYEIGGHDKYIAVCRTCMFS